MPMAKAATYRPARSGGKQVEAADTAKRRHRALVSSDSQPVLLPHVRLYFDPVRQAFALLSPEKVFWPDDVALDILQLCDGERNVKDICQMLAQIYDASPDDVRADVMEFLQDFSDQLLLKL